MIIHADSLNPKPIEKKVEELILKKLFVKVDDSQIFIEKETFVQLLLVDIISIGAADYDMDVALQIALKYQPHYMANPEMKKTELAEALVEFDVEIDAYNYFFNSKDDTDEVEIYDQVLAILNSDDELLTKRLQEIISKALALFISEEVAVAKQTPRDLLISTYAYHVKLIASNDTIDDAVEEFYYANEEIFIKNNLKKELTMLNLEQTATVFKDEIAAYKLALSMQNQNMEIPMILAMVKQILKID